MLTTVPVKVRFLPLRPEPRGSEGDGQIVRGLNHHGCRGGVVVRVGIEVPAADRRRSAAGRRDGLRRANDDGDRGGLIGGDRAQEAETWPAWKTAQGPGSRSPRRSRPRRGEGRGDHVRGIRRAAVGHPEGIGQVRTLVGGAVWERARSTGQPPARRSPSPMPAIAQGRGRHCNPSRGRHGQQASAAARGETVRLPSRSPPRESAEIGRDARRGDLGPDPWSAEQETRVTTDGRGIVTTASGSSAGPGLATTIE